MVPLGSVPFPWGFFPRSSPSSAPPAQGVPSTRPLPHPGGGFRLPCSPPVTPTALSLVPTPGQSHNGEGTPRVTAHRSHTHSDNPVPPLAAWGELHVFLFSVPKYKRVFLAPSVQPRLPLELRIQLLELRPRVSPGLSVSPGWREAEGGAGTGAPGMLPKPQPFQPPPLELPKPIFMFFSGNFSLVCDGRRKSHTGIDSLSG